MHAVLCFVISASQLFSLQIGVSGILLLASHSISNQAARILGALGESSFHTQVQHFGDSLSLERPIPGKHQEDTVAHEGLKRVSWTPR